MTGEERNEIPQCLHMNLDGCLRVVALLEDGSYHFLDDTSRLHGILYHVSLSALTVTKAVDEFEKMINDSALKEKDFQDFYLSIRQC